MALPVRRPSAVERRLDSLSVKQAELASYVKQVKQATSVIDVLQLAQQSPTSTELLTPRPASVRRPRSKSYDGGVPSSGGRDVWPSLRHIDRALHDSLNRERRKSMVEDMAALDARIGAAPGADAHIHALWGIALGGATRSVAPAVPTASPPSLPRSSRPASAVSIPKGDKEPKAKVGVEVKLLPAEASANELEPGSQILDLRFRLCLDEPRPLFDRANAVEMEPTAAPAAGSSPSSPPRFAEVDLAEHENLPASPPTVRGFLMHTERRAANRRTQTRILPPVTPPTSRRPERVPSSAPALAWR